MHKPKAKKQRARLQAPSKIRNMEMIPLLLPSNLRGPDFVFAFESTDKNPFQKPNHWTVELRKYPVLGTAGYYPFPDLFSTSALFSSLVRNASHP